MSKINIVIGTHGKFGEELKNSAEMVIGAMENVYTVSLLPKKSFEDFMVETDAVFAQLEGETIGLVDLFGGTPSNVFSVLTKKYNHHVVTGVNLPMLIELYLNNTDSASEDMGKMVQMCMDAVKTSTVYTNEKL